MKNCFFTWHIGLCLMLVNFVKFIARQARGAAYRPPSKAQGPAQGPALQKFPSPPSSPRRRKRQTVSGPPGKFSANGPKPPRLIHREQTQAPQAHSPQTAPSPPRPIHRKRPQAPQPHLPHTVPGTPRHIHCKRCQAPQAHSPQMVLKRIHRKRRKGLKGNTPRRVISEHAKHIRIYN